MTDNATSQSCPQCGNPIPADAPRGLCPKCVLGGVATATEAGQGARQPDLPALEAVRTAFPQLEIMQMIGQGAMGFVYKARQPNLDRLVALKLLSPKLGADPAFAERFNREARVLARLNHPNIVAVYDFGRSGDFFYLLMEFIDGVNLRQAMRSGRFSSVEALALVPRICDALQFAHEEGILHRDIKPENILLDTRGRLKIADFGIAKLLGESKEDLSLTATGMAVGTPHYMAPEQLEHPQDVDQRADIYSLGVVFYEMLTGELPVGRFAAPSEKTAVDPRVDAVVFRALEKEREKRYGSAGEVKTRVEDIRSSAAPPGPHGTMFMGAVPPPLQLGPGPGAPAAAGPPRGTEALRARWSRKAIAGAALDAMALVPGFVTFVLIPYVLARHGAFRPLAPMLGIMLLGLLVAGVPALVGTILAASALRDTGRAAGQLKGRGLALCAALFWPLLLTDIVILAFSVFVSAQAFGRSGHVAMAIITVLVALMIVAGLDWTVASRAWRWTDRSAAPVRSWLAPPVLVCVLLVISPPALLLAGTVWLPLSLRQEVSTFEPAPVMVGSSDREALVQVTTPPRQAFAVECLVLSNHVAVGSPELRAQMAPADLPRQFSVRWRLLDGTDADATGAPWEVVVENLESGSVEARLRPQDLPSLDWTVSNQAQTIELGSSVRESRAFEVARALQPAEGPDGQPVDWSVELVLRNAGLPPEAQISRGVEAQFNLPAGQVAIFDIVTRTQETVVPVPNSAAYVIAPPDEVATGTFRWLPEPDETVANPVHWPWRIEITAAGNRASGGGLEIPDAIAKYGGQIVLHQELSPASEVIHWAGEGDAEHPAIGLRIRTLAAKPQLASHNSALGIGTNWQKAFSTSNASGRP